MKLAEAGRSLRGRWWLVLLGAVVGMGVAIAGTLLTPATYVSDTELVVVPNKEASGDDDAAIAVQRAGLYAESLVGEDLAAGVIDRLDLDIAPDALSERISSAPVADAPSLTLTASGSSPAEARAVAAAAWRVLRQRVEDFESANGTREPPFEVRVTEFPERPRMAVERQVARNVALGLAVGLLSAVAIALHHPRTVVTHDRARDSRSDGVAPA